MKKALSKIKAAKKKKKAKQLAKAAAKLKIKKGVYTPGSRG